MQKGHKDMLPRVIGWYSVRFKSNLNPAQREVKKLASSFIDWVFFDGAKWDAPEYKELGYYVQNVIKLENKEK